MNYKVIKTIDYKKISNNKKYVTQIINNKKILIHTGNNILIYDYENDNIKFDYVIDGESFIFDITPNGEILGYKNGEDITVIDIVTQLHLATFNYYRDFKFISAYNHIKSEIDINTNKPKLYITTHDKNECIFDYKEGNYYISNDKTLMVYQNKKRNFSIVKIPENILIKEIEYKNIDYKNMYFSNNNDYLIGITINNNVFISSISDGGCIAQNLFSEHVIYNYKYDIIITLQQNMVKMYNLKFDNIHNIQIDGEISSISTDNNYLVINMKDRIVIYYLESHLDLFNDIKSALY